MRFSLLISLHAFVLITVLSPQNLKSQNQTNNYGKEFRFTLLENYGSLDKVSFVVSLTKVPDTIRISVGANTFPHPVYKNLDTIISYTKLTTPNAFQFGPNKGILVTANNDIALYAMNNVLNSSDISSITPSERIPGNPEYFVNTYRGDESFGRSNNSLFSVLAIDDSCYINIMPTADSKYNLVKNSPFGIWLRKGQVYYEQAADSQSFAGTRVWNSNGCKRFVVFEGAKCSYVDYTAGNCSGCDHLYNQSRPIQYLGKSFTTLPYSGMNGGYYYQVVASENNTTVSVNGIPVSNLNQGGVYLYNQSSNISVCITADKAISVVQLMKSGGCNGQPNNLGNPSLMSVIPDNQMTTSAGFSFPYTSNIAQNPSNPAEFYVGIICPAGSLHGLSINDIPVDTAKFTNTCNMAVGSIKLNPALKYRVQSERGFLAYMYAFGKDESYATEIGASFENVITTLLLESNRNSTCDSFNVFRFKAKSDSLATFQWNFGDGTSASGDSVSKQYPKTGQYRLKLTASYPNNKGCTNDTFLRTISVHKRPYFTLGKDSNVCNGVFFQVAPVVEPNVSFRWSNNTTSGLLVVNSSQTVWLTLTDSNKCTYTDTLKLNFVNCDSNSIIIPNVFTPGRTGGSQSGTDDVNDLFETRFSGFDLLKGKIFNRWGQVVYNFEYPKDTYWNGAYDNDLSRPCAAGTYYYIFEFSSSETGQKRSYNGVVQLIR